MNPFRRKAQPKTEHPSRFEGSTPVPEPEPLTHVPIESLPISPLTGLPYDPELIDYPKRGGRSRKEASQPSDTWETAFPIRDKSPVIPAPKRKEFSPADAEDDSASKKYDIRERESAFVTTCHPRFDHYAKDHMLDIIDWGREEAEAIRLAEEKYTYFFQTLHPSYIVTEKQVYTLSELGAAEGLIGYSIQAWYSPGRSEEVGPRVDPGLIGDDAR